MSLHAQARFARVRFGILGFERPGILPHLEAVLRSENHYNEFRSRPERVEQDSEDERNNDRKKQSSQGRVRPPAVTVCVRNR